MILTQKGNYLLGKRKLYLATETPVSQNSNRVKFMIVILYDCKGVIHNCWLCDSQ